MGLGKMDAEFVTVACGLDDNDKQLLEIGAYFAKELSKPIKLVHVVEPWMGNYVGMPVGIVPPLWATNREVMDAQINDAEKTMKAYGEKLGGEKSTVYRIHSGDPAKWILAESQDSAITVVGSGEFSEGVFKRFTTAFQVLSHAEKPVAIIPDNFELDQSQALKVLFADDLEDHSLNAADFVFRLCTKIDPVKLQHVHVTGMTKESLKAGIEMAQVAAHNSSAIPKVDDLYNAAKDSLAKAMAERSSVSQAEFAAGGNTYDQVILEGSPSDKLESFRRDFQPQIQVFGKHQALHKKTFSFGRVPFQSMIGGESLVIVVPS
jgi:nucleotide-binding universal stress UspA family protein